MYEDRYAMAYQRVLDDGSSVTFTKDTSTITGRAVEVPGDPITYAQLELTITMAITLFFVPSTMSQRPLLGSVVRWGDQNYAVRDIQYIRPVGSVIAAKVVATR